MGTGVNNHHQFLPMRHIHTERSKICLHACIVGNYNLPANYTLRISYALETTPRETQPPCTLCSIQVRTILISKLCCNTSLLIKLDVITLRDTHNKRPQQVLASHKCGPQRAQRHTPLTATKNGLRQSLRYDQSYSVCVHHLTQPGAGE
jgi:hypothetical protein